MRVFVAFFSAFRSLTCRLFSSTRQLKSLAALPLLLLAAGLGHAQVTQIPWAQQNPGNSPSARFTAAMAYDAAHGQVVLFGGIDGGSNYLNQTWTWDGSNWTQQNPANVPPARIGAVMAYDAAHGQIVLFGGMDGTPTYRNDTWIWMAATGPSKLRPTALP